MSKRDAISGQRVGIRLLRARKMCSLSICILIMMNAAFLWVPLETVAQDPDDVYVDDDFNPSTPGWNVTAFKTIQDGVDEVAVGGTVHVHNGTYIENVVISKSLDMIGNSSTNTTIAPPWNNPYIAIRVNGSSVANISGFSIVEDTVGETFIGVYVYDSSEATLKELYFENMGWGVIAEEGGIVHVENNIFHRYEFDYYAEYAKAISIRDWYTGVPGNGYLSTVTNNTIIFEDYGWGIHESRTAISLIENNTIIQNNTDFVCNSWGFEHSAGIVLYQYGVPGWTKSTGNNISGFCFGVSTVEANVEAVNDRIDSCYVGYGLMKEHSYVPTGSFLNMSSSSIDNSAQIGISVSVESSLALSGSNITNSSGGVYVFDRAEPVTIEGNAFHSNGVGVKTYRKGTGIYTEILNNSFTNNKEGVHSEHMDIIDGNHFESNEEGIRLQSALNAKVLNNVIVNTSVRPGIWIWKANSNTLTNNSISNGLTGILASDNSDGNTIEHNTIWSNEFGIHIEGSDQTSVEGDDISGCYESGILVSDSEFTNITHGNMTNNYVGVDIQSSNNTIVFNSSLLGNVLWAINATGYVNASGNYFGTNDTDRIDKLVSEDVEFSNPLSYRESGVEYTNGSLNIVSDTEYSKGQIVNGNLTVNPGVNVTFTNTTGHNFMQVNGQFLVVNGSYIRASHGNFTVLATNGSDSDLLNARFEKQMGIGIQTANMTVTNCTFANGTAGIVVNQGVSNIIQDSDFISNSRYGVYLFGSNSNIIQDNLVVLSDNGIQAYNSTLDSLSWNNISANEFGIKVGHSSNASIHNNTVSNNFIGIEVRASMYININNNTIVGNVQLAISVPPFSIGTNAQYNYFGTNDSDQVDKLCFGVDCSDWTNATDSSLDYINGDVQWSTPQTLAKGVIVNGNLTIYNTQVNFSNPMYQHFIQVNGKLEINASLIEGDGGSFVILYLNKSAGTTLDSSLKAFRGIGVQSESNFHVTNSSFTGGTYGLVLWKAENAQIDNSTFESNDRWSIGFFMSDGNHVETSQMWNASVGSYVYASKSNILESNEISNNPTGVWFDSKRYSIASMEAYPKDNLLSGNQFYNNDIGVLASYSDGNTVLSNAFSSNWTGVGVEVSSVFARNLSIDSNLFKDNEYGVLISDGTENVIDNNKFLSTYRSVDIHSSRVTLICNGTYDCIPVVNPNNLVIDNNISADWGYTYGIRLADSHYNFVTNNTVSSSSGHVGILIEYSDNNTLANNSVASSSASRSTYGIYLRYAGGNNLTNNVITNYTYNFGVVGEKHYDFVEDIDLENTVNGRKIYYFVGAHDICVNPEGGYYGFVGSYNIWLGDVETIGYNLQSFLLAYSHHIYFDNVSASNNYYGIQVYRSDKSVIGNSTLTYNYQGIFLNWSTYNTIQNLTSMNATGKYPSCGIYLHYSSFNVITNDTTILTSLPGILIEYSINNTISYSNLKQNGVGGVQLKYTSGNAVVWSYIRGNSAGIYNQYSSDGNFSNNSIVYNGQGIYVYTWSVDNLIMDNNISGNSQYGIYFYAHNNKVIRNDITNNGGYAVWIKSFYGNQILDNNIFHNKGILVESSYSNNISNNYILNSTDSGIRIVKSWNNVFSHNNISDSSGDGVFIDDSDMSYFNQLTYNNFTFNSGYGVKIVKTGGSSQIHHNNFVCNKGNCFYPYQGYENVSASSSVLHFWDDGSVGNYWTIDSWRWNGGFPMEYWLDPDPKFDGFKDQHPTGISFSNAGPNW